MSWLSIADQVREETELVDSLQTNGPFETRLATVRQLEKSGCRIIGLVWALRNDSLEIRADLRKLISKTKEARAFRKEMSL